jgi:hypothetical protein
MGHPTSTPPLKITYLRGLSGTVLEGDAAGMGHWSKVDQKTLTRGVDFTTRRSKRWVGSGGVPV